MTLASIFLDFHAFTEQEMQRILSCFSTKAFTEGEYILKPGEVSDHIYFIESGIIREFTNDIVLLDLDIDSESTLWILAENDWITQVESYVLNKPTKNHLQALTAVKAHYFSKQNFENLLRDIPVLNQLAIKILENYLLQLNRRNYLHKIKKAEKRLEWFEEKSSHLSNRVKLKYIASYLNISPSELSRIRSRRSKFKNLI